MSQPSIQCPACGSDRCYQYRSASRPRVLPFRMYHCGECMAVFSEPSEHPDDRVSSQARAYTVIAEAMAVVLDALEHAKNAPGDPEQIRKLTDAMRNYIALCDEWRKRISRR